MIFISEALQLALTLDSGRGFPLIGWENLITLSNISATSSLAAYPVTNLANPSTTPRQGWQSDSLSTQYLTVDLFSDNEVGYVGFARHNFGSGQIQVTIEGKTGDEGAVFEPLTEPYLPADDKTLFLWFQGTSLISIRAKLEPQASAKPRAAVMSTGAVLEFQNGVSAGTVMLGQGRKRDIYTPITRSGDFLGRLVRGGTRRAQAQFKNVDQDWYREYLDPFLDASAGNAFFWCPDPLFRPEEVNYAWLTTEPTSPTQRGGNFDVTLDLEAII